MLNDEIQLKRVAQKELCESKQWPHFAPLDGMCWSCYKQIYSIISIQQASQTLITGCPFCHKSYCD